MCLWGPTALGNSYWLLIVWQQPTCSGPPLTSKPSSGGVCVVASNALVSLGGHATYPCCPLYPPYTPHLATTTTTPPWTPHSITELAKDRGLFPSCHGDVAREKCKGREGKSGRGGGACAAKCAWAGMSENESGEGERQGEREKGGKGGEFVQTPLPVGTCVSVVTVFQQDWVAEIVGKTVNAWIHVRTRDAFLTVLVLYEIYLRCSVWIKPEGGGRDGFLS